MKKCGLLSNVLVLASYSQLKPCFAEDKKLIRRSLHQWANPGEECHHACDCLGYPSKPVCCEKRGPDMHKKCYRCCLQHRQECKHDIDCCSQRCVEGVCVPNHDPQEPVGLCPILFPGDYLYPAPMGSPFAPFPYYVQPSKTGPLKAIQFCPLPRIDLQKPEGDEEKISTEDEKALSSLNLPTRPSAPTLMYLVKGMCEVDTKWTIIQGGTLMKHWDGRCFKIPIINYSQLQNPHHKVDYTKYHVVFFWQWRNLIWPLWKSPLALNKELMMLAKCNQAWAYLQHGHP